jgi:hypothetical protein
MKTCNKCKQQLPLEMFCKDKSRKDGLHYRCKQCANKASKEFRLDNPEYDDKQFKLKKPLYYIVYLLPDHNYVGMTENPYYRMRWHKNMANRNIDNWIELKKFNNRKDALTYESELHSQGYDGAK